MRKLNRWISAAALIVCGAACTTSCNKDDDEVIIEEREVIVTKEIVVTSDAEPLMCVTPPFLQKGDKVALISPSYSTPMENVEKAADVLRSWGLEPVIGPNADKTYATKYAGTAAERAADVRWAINNPDIKAIICNRGGYGSIQLVDELALTDLAAHPKWVVGFSDITTLHGLLSCAGVMSIHGTMSTFLASSNGKDATSILMRDLLMGSVPKYTVPVHSQNITGKGTGTLVGGNICTFVPLIGSKADATAHKDIILFIEEIGESMHNIDRLFNMLILNGSIARCKGVILGEFVSCSADLGYASVEAMLHQYLEKYNIPVLCGFPAGHDNVNLPLVMGATATIDVSASGATIEFDIDSEQTDINTSNPMPAMAFKPKQLMMMAGKIEAEN
jgi:muramoyltetrapeptide carboxypeptidase